MTVDIPAHLLDRSKARQSTRAGSVPEAKVVFEGTSSVMADALKFYRKALEHTSALVETDEDAGRFVETIKTIDLLLVSLSTISKIGVEIDRILKDAG